VEEVKEEGGEVFRSRYTVNDREGGKKRGRVNELQSQQPAHPKREKGKNIV